MAVLQKHTRHWHCFLTVLTWLLLLFYCSNAEVAPIDPDEMSHQNATPPASTNEEETSNDAAGNWWQKLFKGTPGSFYQGFIATFSVILVSELGDKTFFIAAILAMNNPRWTIYIGAMSALTIMHILSSLFGYATVQFIPPIYTYYASAALFAIFGIKMLVEAWKMSPGAAQEEMNEVQEDIRNRGGNAMEMADRSSSPLTGAADQEAGGSSRRMSTATTTSQANVQQQPSVMAVLARIFVQSFTMTFLAEWGDRSQFATIALAASENVYAVILAGILGHGICTGLAVLGGRMIAQRISVRTVTIVGGIVFLGFAATAFIMDPPKQLH